MTFVSRILGFVRDMIFARFFGADAGTDAFFIAFKIPNFLRRLFAEGAFAQAFVPVLSEYRENGSREALKTFIDRTGGTLAIVLMIVTILGVVLAPFLIMLFAPGFLWQGDRYDLTVEMLRITFPYLFFISSTAFAGSILNTFGRFAVPAFTPVFLNICLISAAIWFAPMMEKPVIALAWGVFVAGGVQLAFQFPSLMRLGLVPRLKPGFSDPGVRRIVHLMLPAIFGVSVTQINLLFDTLIASFLVAGSVSWLYYSDRLVEFPLGVFGIALATVILPNLSRRHAERDTGAFSSVMDWGLRWVLIIGLPSSLGLLLLAEPILSTLFQYNAFSVDDVQMAGKSLMAYSLGLVGFILVKVLVPGFTSRQDTRTPVRFGIVAMLSNMVLNVVLVFQFAHAGLALATSLSAFLNASLLLRRLLKQKVYRPGAGWWAFIARLLAANSLMVAVLYCNVDAAFWYTADVWQRIVSLFIWILAGGLAYGLGLLLTGVRPRHLRMKSS